MTSNGTFLHDTAILLVVKRKCSLNCSFWGHSNAVKVPCDFISDNTEICKKHQIHQIFQYCLFDVFNSTVHVLVQQESWAVTMAFPKHSILQALSVLLLAWMLVHCQAPFKPEEEEEQEPIKETDIATVVTKSEPLECPPECSCTAEGAVDCAGVDLTEFPAELSDKTRQLSLQVFHTIAHT